MKKEILSGLMAFWLLITLVGAVGIPSFPLMVTGKVEGNPGFTIQVTNLDRGVMWFDTTNYAGEYSIDISSATKVGDDIEVKVVECKENCVQVIRWDGSYENFEYINFDMSEACPPFPGCPEPIECPEDTTPYAECDECCDECPDPEECPESDPNKAVEILLTAIASAGVAGGVVAVTLGKKAQHSHRGIRNKHSIFTRHRNATIRHPIGEVAPMYRKEDDRMYHYVPKEDR